MRMETWLPWRRTHPLTSPSPLLIATGEAIPLRGLEGVPGLPGELPFSTFLWPLEATIQLSASMNLIISYTSYK